MNRHPSTRQKTNAGRAWGRIRCANRIDSTIAIGRIAIFFLLVPLFSCSPVPWDEKADWNTETRARLRLAASPRDLVTRRTLGLVYFQREKYGEAISELERVLSGGVDDPQIRRRLALAFYYQGKLMESRRHVEAWLETEPDDAEAQNLLGVICYNSLQLDQAIGHYQRAVQLDAGNDEYHSNLGVALMRKGLYDLAGAEYEKALKLNPGNEVARYNLERLKQRISERKGLK